MKSGIMRRQFIDQEDISEQKTAQETSGVMSMICGLAIVKALYP